MEMMPCWAVLDSPVARVVWLWSGFGLMRVWRDLAARPLRQLTLVEAPLRPLRPPPTQLLVRKVIRALAEHLPCAEHTSVCTAYAPASAAPATCRAARSEPRGAGPVARRTGGRTVDRFPRRTRPSRTRPRQSHCRNHPPALPATQLPAPPTAILSTCARIQKGDRLTPD